MNPGRVRLLLVLAVLMTVALVLCWFTAGVRRAHEQAAATKAAKPAEAPDQMPAEVFQGSPRAAELNRADRTAKQDLVVLHDLLGELTTVLHIANLPPLGDNEDITAALTGKNKMHLVVIPPNHPALDGKGRLMDRWGTPYFFHARSADTFDLRSAGPDKVLFTADDITMDIKEAARAKR